MKHPRLALWLTALSSVLLTVLVELPAAWFAPLAAAGSQGQLQLLNTEGSLWHGSAELLLQGDSGPPWPLPGRLTWRWVAADWLRLHPGLQLEDAGLGLAPWHPRLGWQDLQLGDDQLQLPLQGLAIMGLPWSSLGLSGSIQLQWQGLRLRHGHWQGRLQAQTENMQTKLDPGRPLGPFQLTGRWLPRAMELQLQTLAGPMHLSGTGRWDPHGIHLPLQVHCDDQCGPALRNALELWQPASR